MNYQVLIVEDNPEWQEKLASSFELLGYGVKRVESVAKARNALKTAETPFDLVTVDLNLNDNKQVDEDETMPDATGGIMILEYLLTNGRGEICCIISQEKFTIDFLERINKYKSVVGGLFAKNKSVIKNKLIPEIDRIIKQHKKRYKKIFISYRHKDTEDIAQLISKELIAVFGEQNIFLDHRSINLGTDFRQGIRDFIATCDAILVIIGKQWLSVTDDKGSRRLDDKDDYLRLEVAEGLRLGIRVTPVRVHGTIMPSASELPQDIAKLVYQQGAEIHSGESFETDMQNLIKKLQDW